MSATEEALAEAEMLMGEIEIDEEARMPRAWPNEQF